MRRLAVLIADDSRDAADTLAHLVRAAGHEARTAYTPTEAAIAAEAAPPDVVLMDIGFPGMDGYRLARRLCGLVPRKPMLVAVTGYPGLEDRSRAEGFDHHFEKPADPADVARVLAAAATDPT